MVLVFKGPLIQSKNMKLFSIFWLIAVPIICGFYAIFYILPSFPNDEYLSQLMASIFMIPAGVILYIIFSKAPLVTNYATMSEKEKVRTKKIRFIIFAMLSLLIIACIIAAIGLALYSWFFLHKLPS